MDESVLLPPDDYFYQINPQFAHAKRSITGELTLASSTSAAWLPTCAQFLVIARRKGNRG